MAIRNTVLHINGFKPCQAPARGNYQRSSGARGVAALAAVPGNEEDRGQRITNHHRYRCGLALAAQHRLPKVRLRSADRPYTTSVLPSATPTFRPFPLLRGILDALFATRGLSLSFPTESRVHGEQTGYEMASTRMFRNDLLGKHFVLELPASDETDEQGLDRDAMILKSGPGTNDLTGSMPPWAKDIVHAADPDSLANGMLPSGAGTPTARHVGAFSGLVYVSLTVSPHTFGNRTFPLLRVVSKITPRNMHHPRR